MLKQQAIAIVGPTASGKTALSIALAKHFSGEVISADSRQVYRKMDLGTGKVTAAEMDGIAHHLIDIADPATDIYTGADFTSDGALVLSDITTRGKLPIIAGGTFFYLELLQGKMQSAPVRPNPELRTELESKSNEELFEILAAKDPRCAEVVDRHNPRRLIRALEIIAALGAVPAIIPVEPTYQWLTLGIDVPTKILHERIYKRIIDRLDQGMIKEVQTLHASGVSWERLESFGLEYRYIARYLQNTINHDEMTTELNTKIRQFAKRQLTWLKRDPNIVWLPFPADITKAINLTKKFLNPT